MLEHAAPSANRGATRALWLILATLFLLPLVAMLFTDEVNWDEADFALFSALLFGVGAAYEFAARTSRDRAFRAGIGVALGAAFLLVWINLAVGIIASEDHPGNVMFGGVLAIGFLGAAVARMRPAGLARALVAVALAQGAVAAVALVARWGSAPHVLALTGLFAALWLASAWLFRRAALQAQ
jgi:hypothetical protein